MTVGAAVCKKRFRSGVKCAAMPRVVALDAQKRHGSRQQSAVDRPVRAVAIAAILGNVTMFIGEWPAFFHMAACAQVSGGDSLEHPWLGRAMGVVAVEAAHFPLPDRVMREQAELCLYIRMAAITEFSHFILADLLPGVFMEFVAGKTAQIIQGVNT